MNAGEQVHRVVVVHGPADRSTTRALESVGLVVVADIDGTTVWAPASWQPAPRPSEPEPARRNGRRLLTVGEAAALLGVGRSTAYELIGSGQLEVVHVGRAARIPVAAVDELVQRLRERASTSHGASSMRALGRPDASQRVAAVQPSAS